MKIVVRIGKEKKIKINPASLLDRSLQELLSEKLGKNIASKDIKLFSGTEAVILDGEEHFIDISEEELKQFEYKNLPGNYES